MFPNEAAMLAFFAPVKWAASLASSGNSLLFPDVVLKRLDDMYYEGVAKAMVKNNLTGIFTMAEPREPINGNVVDMTADIFVAKFGGELSAFGCLHYFASYLTEYKSGYARFDLQDVVRQTNKYMERWRRMLTRQENASKGVSDSSVQVGKPALWAYLRNEYLAKGRSVRESNLYKYGLVPEKDVEAIESGEELTI